MIYLAHPFSHPDSVTRNARVQGARYYGAQVHSRNLHFFAPVLYGSTVDPDNARGSQWWETWCIAMLRGTASALLILPFDGWRESNGLKREIAAAKILGIDILSPSAFELIPDMTGLDYDLPSWYGGSAFFTFVNSI